MFCFFHQHQKSLGVQGGHSGLYLVFNGSLKLGPRDGCACTCKYTQTHLHKNEEKKKERKKSGGCLKPCKDLVLIFPLPFSPLFFYSLILLAYLTK